jgi:hypothetical protein
MESFIRATAFLSLIVPKQQVFQLGYLPAHAAYKVPEDLAEPCSPGYMKMLLSRP